ncbi:conserved hypothetical protein [Ricinus communis]|uniref:Uncharacterized protein n=1 Tax=Ricinus communis TaxID=3988 RepID=B9R6Y1_RICCO|nr:conserved hypothetical protein [Ricinus communis]|eukprot:XP_002510074.1 uncharacterized protein LOC8265276 [Ricinus communis]
MKDKKQKQSKFMKIATIPLKVLGKARDLYVKSITGCATRTSYGHSMSMPNGQLPKSHSMGSTMSSDGGDDYGDLIRAASVRSLGHKNEIDMLLQQMKQQQQQQQQQKQLPKSVSVGMGFMGRIEEENGEDEGSVDGSKRGAKADLYPRSRSYAVAERTPAF